MPLPALAAIPLGAAARTAGWWALKRLLEGLAVGGGMYGFQKLMGGGQGSAQEPQMPPGTSDPRNEAIQRYMQTEQLMQQMGG